MFTELTIPLYLEKMAGTSFPSPKGGSALAVAGAMGAALTKMCSQVSANNYPGESRYQEITKLADLLQERFLELADEDTRVVYEMLQAGKKEKDSQQHCETIQGSYAKASDNLFKVGEAANDLIDLAQYLTPLCVPSCIVDLQIVEILTKSIKEAIVNAIGDNYKIVADKGCL